MTLARTAILLLSAAAVRAQPPGCVPETPTSPADAYGGYDATGYKGAVVWNPTWDRAVSTVRGSDGAVRYRLRRASGPAAQTLYDSIEPLDDTPRGALFVAWRDGCGRIVDARGNQPWDREFSAFARSDLVGETVGRDSLSVRVRERDANGDGFRYLLFVRHRLVAVTPHLDRWQYSTTLNGNYALPPGIRHIAIRESGANGAFDARTLREVLAPTWRGVGGLLAYDASARLQYQYLMADDGDGLHLFTTDGQPIPLPRFHRLKQVHGFLRWKRSGDQFTSVFALTDTVRRTCRLVRRDLTPVVQDEIAWSGQDDCARPYGRGSESAAVLAFTNSAGTIQSYHIRDTVFARSARDVSGRLVHLFDTGALIVERTEAGSPVYRILAADGVTHLGEAFSGFEALGCGFVRVFRDGTWYTPYPDGSITTRLFFPFSC